VQPDAHIADVRDLCKRNLRCKIRAVAGRRGRRNAARAVSRSMQIVGTSGLRRFSGREIAPDPSLRIEEHIRVLLR